MWRQQTEVSFTSNLVGRRGPAPTQQRLPLLLCGKCKICGRFFHLLKEYFVEIKSFTSNLIINTLFQDFLWSFQTSKTHVSGSSYFIFGLAFSNDMTGLELFEG